MAAHNRLLIVDDEPGITRVIETVAQELGFEVLAIHQSEQFEKALLQLDPTLICLDIAMPDRDGVICTSHEGAQLSGNLSGTETLIDCLSKGDIRKRLLQRR
jgi:DNA-binding NtrC family response regulator